MRGITRAKSTISNKDAELTIVNVQGAPMVEIKFREAVASQGFRGTVHIPVGEMHFCYPLVEKPISVAIPPESVKVKRQAKTIAQ